MLLMVSQNLKSADLISLSVSTKRFAPIAQHILYKSMTITRTADDSPFSQVLKTLLAQPELRSKVKSVSLNCRSTGKYNRSAAGCDLRDKIEEAWGQLDCNSDDYKQWALRLIDCCEQGYAGVVLSLLPNVVKLDIANDDLQYMSLLQNIQSRVPSCPELVLFGALQPMAPRIAGLSKLQELTLAFKSLGFLSWGFSRLIDLTIRWINENDIANVCGNENAPYHLQNLKSLTIEVPSHLDYSGLTGQWKSLLQKLFDTLKIPSLDRLSVKIYSGQYSHCVPFDVQDLMSVVHTAHSGISNLSIHNHARVIDYLDSNHGLIPTKKFLNLRHLSVSFSAFGPAYAKFKNIPEIIPRSIQHIRLLNPSKDVLFWLNMLEISRKEYPDLKTVSLVSDMDTPDWKPIYRLLLQKQVTNFEKLGIRVGVVRE
jgi:hypothetical protein